MINPTIFLDLDGTVFEHVGGGPSEILLKDQKVLPGVREAFDNWRDAGFFICVTSARPECLREFTHNQLIKHGLLYDQLVLGISHGTRIVINDTKPSIKDTAIGISVERNTGLSDITVEYIAHLPPEPEKVHLKFEYSSGSYPEGCCCQGCCRLAGIKTPLTKHYVKYNGMYVYEATEGKTHTREQIIKDLDKFGLNIKNAFHPIKADHGINGFVSFIPKDQNITVQWIQQ